MRLLELCMEINDVGKPWFRISTNSLGPPLEYRFRLDCTAVSPFCFSWFSFYCAAIAAASITFATSDGFEMNPTGWP